MSNYLIELSMIHVVLFGAYWIIFRNETQFGKMRFVVLGASLMSLTIPLLRLPKLFQNGGAPEFVAGTMEVVMLEEMTISAQNASQIDFSILTGAYMVISGFFLVRLIVNLSKLIKLERESHHENFFNTRILRSPKIKGSFTFFNWIFLSEDVQPDQKEYDVILRHEKAHVALGHTYDLIFLELFKVVFWWLPTAWLAQKEIKKIHEYQADAHALKSFSLDRYSSILISSTLKANGLSLASSFHDGLIFKRLKAMKQKAKNVSPWKIGTVTLLTALLFVAFACSEEMEAGIKEMGESSNSISFDQLPTEMQSDLQGIKDDLTFIKVEMPQDEMGKSKIGEIDALRELDPSTIHSMNVVKNEEFRGIYIAIKKEGVNFDYLAQKSKMDGEVFTVVEQKPEFPGGKDALMKYLISELKYPKDAEADGVEGRVMVQFIVDKDGSIKNVEALKGIAPSCDEEAVRVIANMPNWNPGSQRGKKVAVRMLMPIVFSLSGDKASASKIMLNETKSDFNKMIVNAELNDGIWQGKVTNAESGKAMAGVNVVEQGSSNGTVTDLDGSFSLKPKNSGNPIVLSHIGYQSAKLEAAK